MTNRVPPTAIRHELNIQLIHQLDELYQKLYLWGRKINKRDRFGIWSKIENLCLESIILGLEAGLSKGSLKIPPLTRLHLKVEILKRLLRISQQIKTIELEAYLSVEGLLQEISKRVFGWLEYTKQELK